MSKYAGWLYLPAAGMWFAGVCITLEFKCKMPVTITPPDDGKNGDCGDGDDCEDNGHEDNGYDDRRRGPKFDDYWDDANGGDANGGDANGGDANGGDANGGDANGGDEYYPNPWEYQWFDDVIWDPIPQGAMIGNIGNGDDSIATMTADTPASGASEDFVLDALEEMGSIFRAQLQSRL